MLAKPGVAAFKEVRDAIIRDIYCARPARNGAQLAEVEHLKGATVAVTIAFEQAWLIRHLVERFQRFSHDAQLIVLDNSRTEKGASEIKAVCEAAGTPYLRLPSNPVRNINRSHGNALNWAYRNVIRKLAPRRFGFFDHDLFPGRPFSIEESLGGQQFYGLKIDRGFGWALWAGYCMFDYDFVSSRNPDFNPDMDRRLITGGRNHGRLYRTFDANTLRFATHSFQNFKSQRNAAILDSELVDGWLHIGGSSYHAHKLSARAFYEELLEGDAFAEGGTGG
jgi:hypothetical protein